MQNVKSKTDAELRNFLGDWWVDELDFEEHTAECLAAAANALLEQHYVTLRVVNVEWGSNEDAAEYVWHIAGWRNE